MQIFDFSNDQFNDIAHLLPDSFIALITVVGAEDAFTLLRHYSGTTIPIGKNSSKAGRLLHVTLLAVLCEESVTKLETAYANQRKLWIPKCDDALRELRDRFIRSQFNDLTQNNRMSSNLAVNNLAVQHRLTDRHVWHILKQSNRLPTLPKTAQLPLF